MTSHKQTLDLPYRPEDLFDLVADVRRYPEFVKWLHTLRVISETQTETTWTGRAEASVGFRGFSETFTTDVAANRDDLAIDVKLVRGPFRKLRNTWRFTPSPTGSRVDFTIDFEFSNFILQALADANRQFAINRIIDAFTAEAARRYPRVETPT
jgi:coenzyme Q-binding protein COQ10